MASTRRSTDGVAASGNESGTSRPRSGTGSDGERNTERTAEAGDHDALRDELPDQSLAPGTECRAHGKLPLPPLRASEEEAGKIGARDEQHAHCRTTEGEQQQPRLA